MANDAQMPERIWLIPDIGWDGETAWSNDPAPEPGMDPDNATEYLRKDLCALTPASQPEGQVRVLDVDDLAQIIRVVDGNNTLGAGELAEAILEAMPAPQPSAATTTAQEAVPVWKSVERKFYRSEWPLAKLLEARNGGLVTDEGEAWVYRYTHKDGVGGEYDMLVRRELVAHPPQPSETVAEALHNLICCAEPYMRDDAQTLALSEARTALRALKGCA